MDNTEYILIAVVYMALSAVVIPLWLLIDKNFLLKQLLESGDMAAKSLSGIADTLAITNAFLWFFDGNGRVVMDSGFYKKFGLRERPISQDTILRMVHPDDREPLLQAVRDVRKCRLELRLRFPLWEDHTISLDISELDDNGCKKSMGMVMLVDGMKQQERDRMEAFQIEEDSDIKSCFLAAMGHEVKNPLNAIVGFSRLVIEFGRSYPRESLQKYCDIIDRSSEDLLSMVNDVIQYSETNNRELQLSLSRKRVCDLMEELYAIHVVLVPGELEFRFEKGGNTDYVMVNRSSITQVVSNFVNNAVRFTHRGYITLGWTSGSDSVTIFVEDSGDGVPDDIRGTIFSKDSPYRDNKGAGIGLPLCKRLVEKMGGSISFSSAVGKGSRFCVSLPKCKK